MTTLAIDAPCGRLRVEVAVEAGKVQSVAFECVPSFVVGLDLEVELPALGTIRYDLAYGGVFTPMAMRSRSGWNWWRKTMWRFSAGAWKSNER